MCGEFLSKYTPGYKNNRATSSSLLFFIGRDSKISLQQSCGLLLDSGLTESTPSFASIPGREGKRVVSYNKKYSPTMLTEHDSTFCCRVLGVVEESKTVKHPRFSVKRKPGIFCAQLRYNLVFRSISVLFPGFYFIMEALYSLGVILLKRLKHFEKYCGLSKWSKSEIWEML
jgi:hypothetical protein